MRNEMREDFDNDIRDQIAELRSRAGELERESAAARTRMFWALNVALLSLISQGLAGNWGTLTVLVGLLFLMGIGADYYSEKRLLTFTFFKDSWSCLIIGWKALLRLKSTAK